MIIIIMIILLRLLHSYIGHEESTKVKVLDKEFLVLCHFKAENDQFMDAPQESTTDQPWVFQLTLVLFWLF